MVDYQKILRNLSSEGYIESGRDPQRNFHQAIGFLHRTRASEEYESIINDYIVPEIPELNPQSSGSDSDISQSSLGRNESSPPPYSTTTGATIHNNETQIPSPSSVNMWSYTQRLWEEGLSSGQLPTVAEEMLCTFPPRHKLILTYRGVRGEGEASTKKQAKHIASKHICQQLGILL